MEYIVLAQDGNEYGPVDADTLIKWVEHGRVFKDTQVRNSLMTKWNEAGTLDFLEDAFAKQEVHEEEEEGVGGKMMDALGLKDHHELTPDRQVNTAFKYKYIPNPGSVGQRIGAFVVDSIIIGVFGILLFLMMNISCGTLGFGKFEMASDNAPAEKAKEAAEEVETDADGDFVDPDAAKETPKAAPSDDSDIDEEIIEMEDEGPFVATEYQMRKLNSRFGTFFFIFITGVFLYYGLGLGLFAQTYGMWFWGLIIVKGYDSECFPARAFAFTLAMFAIGIVTPIVVAVNPDGRSLHGYLTGARIVRVAAKPKA
jgi:hypothetical protein